MTVSEPYTRPEPNRILVAGAGPAGLSCAYWSAKEGIEVTVFEKEEELGEKPCGELIPEETLDYTPFNAGSSWILNRIERGKLYYKYEYVKELIAPSLKGYTIDKRAFLEDLLEEAEALGAQVRMGEKLTTRKAEKMGYDLLVDATGYHRSLAKSWGLTYGDQKLASTMQGYCHGDIDRHATNLNLSDFGYAWAFPRGEIVNFGAGGFFDRRDLEKCYREGLEFFDLKTAEGQAPRRTLDLVGGPVGRLRIGRCVVVGEAAGAIMSTTGEGIRFALWSGSICFRENYEQLFWKGYGDRLRMSGKLLRMALTLDDEKRLQLLKLGSNRLHAALLDGVKPGLRDLVAVPWLLPHLSRFWAFPRQTRGFHPSIEDS